MILASLSVLVLFTCWAYYRVLIRHETTAWREVEIVAVLIVVFLVTLYLVLHVWKR